MDTIATVIRIVTVPPVMILALLITFYSLGKGIFAVKTTIFCLYVLALFDTTFSVRNCDMLQP